MKRVSRKGSTGYFVKISWTKTPLNFSGTFLNYMWSLDCSTDPMVSEQLKVKASALFENTFQMCWNTTSRKFLLQAGKSIDWRKKLVPKSSSTEFLSESELAQFVQFVLVKFKSPQTKARQSFGMLDKFFSKSAIEDR